MDMNRIFIACFGTLLLFLNSCSVVGGIFKAGVWVGVLLVIAFIALIIYLVTRTGSGKS
jgi:hypothetical protein